MAPIGVAREVAGEPHCGSHRLPRCIKELVNRVAEMVGKRPVHITVHQGDARPEEMEWLLRTIEERFELRELYQSGITPVVGTHFGPGGAGPGFLG